MQNQLSPQDRESAECSKGIRWDVQSAVGALAASAANELPDMLLMRLLATAPDRKTVNLLFEEIFDRYQERVRAWCYRVTKNQDRMFDLSQEVFLKAFRNVHNFRGDSQLSTWLYAITRNHCLNSLKKWKTEPEDSANESTLALLKTPDESVHTALERTQSFEQLTRVLGGLLTPMEIRILTLHYVHDLTLPDITRNLMLSNRSGAKAYIVRAHRKLRILVQEGRWNQPSKSVATGQTEKRAAA
jgi:RNA polymerase sigma-70 factor (ECF subfamily)